MIVYISGKYSGDVPENIAVARKVAIEVWEKGMVALCPHLNTAHFEADCSASYDDYLIGDIQLLARCDAILMLPNWQESNGACKEYEYARNNAIPVYYYPVLPEMSETEIKRPRQVDAFINVVMKMYRVHLAKNADYSPANILGTGEIGLVTRIWDKVARLMNLIGFRMEVSGSVFELSKNPKNESIDDSIMDLAVYAVIWMLNRLQVWGK